MVRKAETLGAVTSILCLAILWLVLPPPKFMKVHEMEVIGSDVHVVRTIRPDAVIADWRVTVVRLDKEAPSCQTVPGSEIHQGWSPYSKSEKLPRIFSMDAWVGDKGCWERLEPGPHKMFVTWTPRDGTPPVTAHHSFVIG